MFAVVDFETAIQDVRARYVIPQNSSVRLNAEPKNMFAGNFDTILLLRNPKSS
jgi:hypothetical protein